MAVAVGFRHRDGLAAGVVFDCDIGLSVTVGVAHEDHSVSFVDHGSVEVAVMVDVDGGGQFVLLAVHVKLDFASGRRRRGTGVATGVATGVIAGGARSGRVVRSGAGSGVVVGDHPVVAVVARAEASRVVGRIQRTFGSWLVDGVEAAVVSVHGELPSCGDVRLRPR
jgi:hypothetical protein